MTTYQSAIGENNVAGLTDIDPQPATPELPGVDAFYNADGSVTLQGAPYLRFRYNDGLTQDTYNALRTQFGLSDTVYSARNTVRIARADGAFANYNATIVHIPNEMARVVPLAGWFSDVIFMVKDLEAL